VAFRPDGRTLAACGESRTLCVWDLSSGRQAHALTDLEGELLDQAWSADGRLLATAGGLDGTARVWDMTVTPPRGRVFRMPHFVNVRWLHGVAFTPEGRYLATANPDGTVYVLRLTHRGEVFQVIDLDRRAAEWALTCGGRVTVRHGGKETMVEAAAALPAGPFVLTRASLDGCKQIGDDGLKHLAGLDGLTHLNLEHTSVGDVGLTHLIRLSGLISLNLQATAVTDASLSSLTSQAALRELVLKETRVTAEGVARLRKALPECKVVTD
jgi:WD40 repeat protein